MTSDDVARLEAERLRPMPPQPGQDDLIRDLIGVLYRACRDRDSRLPDVEGGTDAGASHHAQR